MLLDRLLRSHWHVVDRLHCYRTSDQDLGLTDLVSNKAAQIIIDIHVAWHAMASHGMPCHAIAWHAMACHCMPWHAVACHGMPLHAMACHGKRQTHLEESALIYYLNFTVHTPIWPQGPWDHFIALVNRRICIGKYRCYLVLWGTPMFSFFRCNRIIS